LGCEAATPKSLLPSRCIPPICTSCNLCGLFAASSSAIHHEYTVHDPVATRESVPRDTDDAVWAGARAKRGALWALRTILDKGTSYRVRGCYAKNGVYLRYGARSDVLSLASSWGNQLLGALILIACGASGAASRRHVLGRENQPFVLSPDQPAYARLMRGKGSCASAIIHVSEMYIAQRDIITLKRELQ
jgi:hypothetical protein